MSDLNLLSCCESEMVYQERAKLGETRLVRVRELAVDPYASIVCYPHVERRILTIRLAEMRRLKIQGVLFQGSKSAFNMQILGKGYVGVVVLARRADTLVALKIRRVDSGRSGMQHEAVILRRANLLNVGPGFVAVSKNFLVTEFVNGLLFPEWLETRKSRGLVKRVVRDVLEQCFRLDQAHIDHGELSYAPRHLIVDRRDRPFIVDFETASLRRRPSNVTSVSQFLFLSGAVGVNVEKILGKVPGEKLIDALRKYKHGRSRETFEQILRICNLHDVVD